MEVVHNASIVNAVSAVGLQLYAFGQIVSIPFFRDQWRPDSFYDKIHTNTQAGLHTLCLLDIKVKEQSADNMARYNTHTHRRPVAACLPRSDHSLLLCVSRGVMVYEAPRYMTVNQCIEQLLEVEERRKEGGPSTTTRSPTQSQSAAQSSPPVCSPLLLPSLFAHQQRFRRRACGPVHSEVSTPSTPPCHRRGAMRRER